MMFPSRAQLALVLVVAGVAPAHADKAIAEAAYNEGKRLAGEGKYAEACPKFQASYDEDPQIGVLLNLADCHERIGLLASAWAEFREAAESAGKRGDSREQFAQQRAADLDPRISHLVIHRPATPIPGLVVRRDGKDVTALLEDELPVDPGEHTINASAPGREPWEAQVTIEGEADREEVTVPELATPEQSPPEIERAPATEHREVVDTHRRDQRRRLALISGGVGIVSAGLGLFFGSKAFGDYDESRPHCPDDICDATGRDLVDSARGQALRADVLVGVGVAALAAGAVLWISAPAVERRLAVAPALGDDEAGVVVRGTF